MSTDAGTPIAPRAPFPVDLPRIVGMEIRRIPFDAPRHKYFKSSLAQYTEAIEFIVEIDGEVPTRAYGPALFIGDAEVNQSERIGKTTWRFLYFEPDRLKPGAPIFVGWMKDPEQQRLPTDLRYAPDLKVLRP